MKKIFFLIFFIITSFSTLDIKAETQQVPNNQSRIITNDGMFGNGLPDIFHIDKSKKVYKWGWGNWSSNAGYANLAFSQTGPDKILTELGMIPKKILKSWNVKDFKLGKKRGFKSSGYRAIVHLVKIKNKNCAVVISRFGASTDAQNRVRSSLDGYFCKNTGEITIDEGMNFMHCMELKGEGTNFIGRGVDDQCIIKTAEKKNKVAETVDTLTSTVDENNKDSFEVRLEKLKSLFDKKLITKEEYKQKRQEIIDEM